LNFKKTASKVFAKKQKSTQFKHFTASQSRCWDTTPPRTIDLRVLFWDP